ncbi:FHA domain-containing protein [candidate division KSB1 bacterium]|nr:FHA domain-containing protein [candidate division KSB1 bacterium]
MTLNNSFLEVIHGPLKGRVFPLDRATVTIGREEDNDITIPDRTVSRRHATFAFLNDYWNITDSSVNGIKVNGARVKEQILTKHSQIEIGPCILLLREMLVEDTSVDKTLPYLSETVLDSTSTDALMAEENDDVDSSDADSTDSKDASQSLFKSPIGIAVIALFAIVILLPLFVKKDEAPKGSNSVQNADAFSDCTRVEIPTGVINGNVPGAVLAEAESIIKVADRYYKEELKSPVNLYEASWRYEKGIRLLAKYNNRPASFEAAVENLKSAKLKLQVRYRENILKIGIAMQRGEYNLVLSHTRIILESIPDKLDGRYIEAKRIETNTKSTLEQNPY